MSKKDYRVRNWKDYNSSLVGRGSITYWINEECIQQWKYKSKINRPGRPQKFSDMVIEIALTIKALFRLTFRATQGFLQSLFKLLNLDLEVPNYTLLCKRQKNLKIKLPKIALRPGEKLHLALDTTGLKVYGEGEWKVRIHGWVKRRTWRKLHIAMNTQNHQIEAFELTTLGVQDFDGAPLLLNQISDPIDSVRGDGAYDTFSCYEEAERRKFRLITPPHRNAKPSTERKKIYADPEAIKKRDEVVNNVREIGRDEWKKQSGYTKRSLAETTMFRLKTILGNSLSSRKFENQKVEVAIRCKIINKMTMIGMPQSVAIN